MPSITGGSQFDDDCQNRIKSPLHGEISCGYEYAGVVHLCSPCHAKRKNHAPATDVNEKRDFENLDTRLYLALKGLIKAMDARGIMRPVESELGIAQQDALMIMRDFEDSHGPLPEFAIARNFGLELVPGTQLFTKNGRRTGNGWLVKITQQRDAERATRQNPYGEYTMYTVLTDVGSIMEMTEQDLESQFEVGDWICTLDRIASDFDRHGVMKEFLHG